MRIKRTVVLAALAAAAVTVGLGQSAGAVPEARPAPQKEIDSHVVTFEPTEGHRTSAAAGGGRGHDFTGDGIPDILARQWGSSLVVYPNSGTFNGTATYPSSTFVNEGWGSFTWVGSADLNGDGFADVVGRTRQGDLYAAVHSGTFGGTRTLKPGLVYLGSGWNINDMVYVYDLDGDGFDDILARRAGTGNSYVYYNNGGITGTTTFQAPIQFMSGGDFDAYQGIADVDLDGSPDFVWTSQSGGMFMIPLNLSNAAYLGYGWQTIDTIVFTDVDNDGRDDILGRRASDSSLFAYRHSGTYAPVDGTAFGTFRAPALVGTNWYINDVIS